MAAAGAPLRAIQEWMGHCDYTTTLIYADYAPDPSQGTAWAERAFGLGIDPARTRIPIRARDVDCLCSIKSDKGTRPDRHRSNRPQGAVLQPGSMEVILWQRLAPNTRRRVGLRICWLEIQPQFGDWRIGKVCQVCGGGDQHRCRVGRNGSQRTRRAVSSSVFARATSHARTSLAERFRTGNTGSARYVSGRCQTNLTGVSISHGSVRSASGGSESRRTYLS